MGKDLFDVFFDSDFYSFGRMVRDKRPYQIVNEEGRTIIIHSVVGLGKDDIKIEVKPIDDRTSYLSIEGYAKDDILIDEEYNVKSRFTVKHNDIEDIEKKVHNGILYLTINWKKHEVPKIEIKEI